MVKLNKKRNNTNSVSAYYTCGCPFGCTSCGCSCPPTGISSGTVQNQTSSSPTWKNAPQANEQIR